MNRQVKELTKAMVSAIASLLLSVKNTFIEYQTKLIPFAKAFFGFCLAGVILASCASGQKRAGNIWWADYTQSSRGDCSIDGQKMGEYWFNDTKSKTYGYQIPHGQHNVEISTRWSNGFEDSTQLAFDVKEGKKYTFQAYELQEGQDPNAPVVLTTEYQDQTYKGSVGGKIFKDVWEITSGTVLMTVAIAASPYIVLSMPVWLPPLYLYEKNRKDLKRAAVSAESQTNDAMTETVEQPPEYTVAQPLDTTAEIKTKPEDTATTVSQLVVRPPVPSDRPFDGCCYVWIEDADTREVVAGTRLPGAGR